jgi:predicted transglutaminase-like cysteine proteinase
MSRPTEPARVDPQPPLERLCQRLCRAALASAFTLLAACAATDHSPRVYDFERPGEFLTDAEHYERWARLLEAQAEEQREIRACLDDDTQCPRHLRGYRVVIERAAAHEPARQMRVVNQFINQRRWRDKGRSEDWQTLGEFFRRGGACEDAAIAKYFALRELGFPAEDLRVVIARDPANSAYHAVVAVNLDDEVHLLDVDNSVLTGLGHRRYRFLVSLNELAVWDHGGLR